MTRYRVRHETVYSYEGTVLTSHNEARLLPRPGAHQILEGVELHIAPTPDTVSYHRDYFGNDVVFFASQAAHDRLVIRTESRVDVRAPSPPEPSRSPPWEHVVDAARRCEGDDALSAFEFTFASPTVPRHPALADYARPSFAPGRPLLEAAVDLTGRIHREFRYDPMATSLTTPVLDALRGRHGVCQDYAHVMIGALRSLGLPARYVSGYLRSPDPSQDRPDEPSLVGAEASHAWVQVWCPVHGWVDLDPTNDLVPGDRHVTLAYGRDYDDVAPVKGVTIGGGLHFVTVSVQVRPADGSGATQDAPSA